MSMLSRAGTLKLGNTVAPFPGTEKIAGVTWWPADWCAESQQLNSPARYFRRRQTVPVAWSSWCAYLGILHAPGIWSLSVG